LVSIIIPTAGLNRLVRGEQVDLLANCVRSIVAMTERVRYEIIYVDNGDLREETKKLLDKWGQGRVRNVTFDGPFNVAEKMNLGAAHAAGEHLLFLNDDIEVLSAEWLSAMLEFSQQKGVGAVGAKLYFPDGSIQHAGVRIYPGGVPGHLYYNYPEDQQEVIPDLNAIRNYSAVTGACMLTRREVFEEVGAFSPKFPINYNDVDYCLKVRARDYRIVYTPYAELFHFESVSRVAEKTHGAREEETKLFTDTWGHKMPGDPYHNPLLDPLCFKYVPDEGVGDSV
jgi:GT2 family glycosyltransferase